MNKLGHQAPKGWRINRFNYITLNGDWAYCLSHNFVYNVEFEREKLYNALPCYYTDIRFVDTIHNYSGHTDIVSKRFNPISLKSCIRRIKKVRNIPLGTIVKFTKSWYVPRTKLNLSYLFKIKKENKLDIKYEISLPEYRENFEFDEFSRNLTNKLRENGFIVAVYKDNSNFISSMISAASTYIGKQFNTIKENGEIAIAYGFGKKIGFSSKNNNFKGYSNGCNNILWDRFGEFDKWSRCNEIPKSINIDEIITHLTRNK